MLARCAMVSVYMLTMASLILAATGIGLVFRLIGFHEANIVIVYILSVLLTARFTQGYAYGILSSVLATLAFNFFFTEPYYTLSVKDPSYFFTFGIIAVVAVVTSALTSREKQRALEAREREAQTAALYHLSNQLSEAGDMESIAAIAQSAIGSVLRCPARVLTFEPGKAPPGQQARQGDGRALVWSEAPGEAPDGGAPPQGGWFLEYPVQGREHDLGVVRIPGSVSLSESQERVLKFMIESAAMALERLRNAQARARAAEEAEKERYRGNLLRSISHDLRTPLSGIMGTAEMLRGMTDPADPRRALVDDVYLEADRLHEMVRNILSLTRLRDGAQPLVKRPEPAEEVAGAAARRVARQSGREIGVETPPDVLFVPMDAGLIEQVLMNLLDNAVKHTPSQSEIRVSVRHDAALGQAVFRVSDRGEGIAGDDFPHVFELFYTSKARRADAARGVGLGLTICEAIVQAHGGAITARNREDGPGAVFEFTLPMEDTQDAAAK